MEIAVSRLLKQNSYLIDIPITDLCNLNCAGCLSFSSLSKSPNHVKIEELVKSVKHLEEIGCSPCAYTLSGGEPLLHPNLKELISSLKEVTNKPINILTNGILIKKRINDIQGIDMVCFSKYSGLKYNEQINLLKQNGIKTMFHLRSKDYFINLGLSETKNSDQVTSEIFNKKCFLNCLSLKDSRLYSCRVTSNVHVLNEYFGTKFEITESDFLDIFKIKDKNEILEFIKNKHEFCKYCNFNSKIKFSKSKKLSEEWIFKS